MKIDYRFLKAEARRRGCRVTDLIALAPQNDAFYCGTPGEVEKAAWFKDLWERFGYDSGIHIRRMHYQIISQDPPVMKPNGKPYENTENDWSYLNLAAKAARYLGYVRPEAFVDKRNPDPHIEAHYWGDWDRPAYHISAMDYSEPYITIEGFARCKARGYHCEVWVEKSTMDDVLLPICRYYDVNLVTGVGELSITSVIDLLRRVKSAGDRPVRIAYVSDFDPAGLGMPISVARKVEFFIQERGLDLDVRLYPVALSIDQIREYSLPRTPIKESEKRRNGFEEAFGAGAVELDALEALHPGALADIVKEFLERYTDHDALKTLANVGGRLEADVDEALQEAMGDLWDEWQAVRERVEKIKAAFEEAIETIDIDVDDYELPETKVADEPDSALFDSRRDYFDQLAVYQGHRSGEEL